MKLDYNTILSPEPIALSIGTLRNPTLREFSRLTFKKLDYYEFFMKLTPETFYTIACGETGKEYWESLSDKDRKKLTVYDILLQENSLALIYEEILNFFFIETVVFKEGFFVFLKENISDLREIYTDDIKGVVGKELFQDILGLLQQICCIYDNNEKNENIKSEDIRFKNNLAKRIFEKITKTNQKEEKKRDINLSLANIISAVSNRHPSINPINVWDLTVFQLLDSFGRIQANTVFDIDSTRISVWGDEKKTFDFSLWYTNEYDKQNRSE